MSEDQNLPVQDSGVATSVVATEGVSQASSVASSTEGFVTPTHQDVVVPTVLSDVMDTIKTPNLAVAEEVPGVQQHPAVHATITGNMVTLPDGFGTREDALAATGGKASEGPPNAGKVYRRQDQRNKVILDKVA